MKRLLLPVLIVFLVGGGFISGSSRSDSLSIDSVISQVTEKIKEHSSKEMELKQVSDYSLWWVDDEGYSIINDSSRGIELQIQGCDSENPRDFSRDIQSLIDDITEILSSNGFVINKNNTSDDFSDEKFYDYVVAFEKAETRAVIVLSPDCWSTGSEPFHQSFYFAYTDQFVENQTEQLPYLKDLDLRDGEVIHIEKLVDDFALIDVNYRRSGHFIIAKRIENKWQEIFGGQDVPNCALLRKWDVPADFIECYE